jgi:hypothetical protein
MLFPGRLQMSAQITHTIGTIWDVFLHSKWAVLGLIHNPALVLRQNGAWILLRCRRCVALSKD